MSTIINLNKVDCRDCYKCIRNCLLKAIRYKDGHAVIIDQECIECGECVVTCPRNGRFVPSELYQVLKQIHSGAQVVASVDPAFISVMDVSSIENLRDALGQLGFADAQEAAVGAEIVAREYERLMSEHNTDVLISSTCPAINMLVCKYYPDMLEYLAPVKSHMQVHCEMLRAQYPDAYIVYISPCYVRKTEAIETGCCDCVILFSELKNWLHREGIPLVNEGMAEEGSGIRARRFPRQDGIVKAMSRVPGWNRVSIDGVGDCIAALDEMRLGGVKDTFLEMTACEGSCVNGPAIRSNTYENRIRGTVKVNSYAGENDFGVTPVTDIARSFAPSPVRRIEPSEEEIQRTLVKLNKSTAATALNCGCCGYNTCREMATAICQGKAEPDMCLPYLREKAERHSREVVDSTLDAADRLIDKQMRVVQEVASLLGETTAETKVMLVRLKEAIQGDE